MMVCVCRCVFVFVSFVFCLLLVGQVPEIKWNEMEWNTKASELAKLNEITIFTLFFCS